MALFSSKDPAAAAKAAPRIDGATPQPSIAFVGPEIVFDGVVTGNEFLLIEGTVRGKINLTSDLRIGPRARVDATVHARNVTIEGKLTGDVSADDRVELVTSADVEGNVRAPKIVVAEGAKFRGNVDMGANKPPTE
jgi:cytoskeletal protein CcmA (bactofilin family)